MPQLDPNQPLNLPTLAAAIESVTMDMTVNPAVSPPCMMLQETVQLPDVATTTYSFTFGSKYEIVDVVVNKSGAGAGNTIQIKDPSGNAISDAIAAAVDKAVTRAGSLDPAFNPRTGISGCQITNSRAAGSALCNVTLCLRRR